MERFYEEVEGRVWTEKEIREELFKGVLDTIKRDAIDYIDDKDVDTLDSNYELLKLAIDKPIGFVIDELTNVHNWNFVNVDEIIDSEKFTDNIDNLKKAIKFFEKYYRACNGVKNTFEYQCIGNKFVDNLGWLVGELTNVDYTLEKMEKEFDD